MKRIILGIFATLMFTVMISCTDTMTTPQESQEFRMQINSDGSLDHIAEIGERPNKDTVKKDTSDRKRDTVEKKRDTSSKEKRDTVKKQNPTIFKDLLIRLDLDSTQKSIVERLLAQHRSCIENCVKPLKEAEAAILSRARVQEQEIKKALSEGKITKAQAREKLSLLKANVNKALKEIPIRAKVQECIKGCDAAFIHELEKILYPKQKLILKTWIDSRSKRGTSDKKDTIPGKRG